MCGNIKIAWKKLLVLSVKRSGSQWKCWSGHIEPKRCMFSFSWLWDTWAKYVLSCWVKKKKHSVCFKLSLRSATHSVRQMKYKNRNYFKQWLELLMTHHLPSQRSKYLTDWERFRFWISVRGFLLVFKAENVIIHLSSTWTKTLETTNDLNIY